MAISINNQNNVLNDIELTKYDSKFISEIHDELTLFGELMHSIPQKQIIANIKTSARFFYEHSPNAVSETFFLLRKKDIEDFTKSADNISGFNGVNVKLPPQIRVVKSVKVIENKLSGNDFTKDYSPMTMGMQSGTTTTAPTRNMGMVGYGGIDRDLFFIESVVRMVENRAIKTITKSEIPYSYSQATNTLIIKGKVNEDVGLHVKCDVPIYNLYNDSMFRRHVISLCHQSLKRKIGGMNFELNGGVTMSADEICNKADDQTTIEESVKNSSGLGAVIFKR